MRTAIAKSMRQRQGLRPSRRRREESARPAREREAPPADPRPPRPRNPEERSRREGGPQDQALFVCRCGSAFQTDVTASVRCPHCGEPQAW